MAKCTLDLDLDHPEAVPLVPGQILTGRVLVDVDKEVRCRKLTVDLFWRTHGSGNRTTGSLQRLVLFEGQWTAGEQHVYAFELEVPNGPQTYHGHHLNVDWYVNANADIPWAFDPSAEIDLLYDAKGVETYDHGPRFQTGFEGILGTLGSIGMTVFGLFLVGFSSIFCFAGLAITLEEGTPFGLLFMLFPLPFIGMGAWMIFSSWRSKLAERLLGPVDVEVAQPLQPGDSVDLLIHCEPIRALTLNGLRLALVGREQVVRGSGTNRTTYRHEFFRDAIQIEEGRQLAAGEHAIFAHAFTLPADAPPSFGASDNALHWEVEIQFDIPRWPDWLRTWQLAVRPSFERTEG